VVLADMVATPCTIAACCNKIAGDGEGDGATDFTEGFGEFEIEGLGEGSNDGLGLGVGTGDGLGIGVGRRRGKLIIRVLLSPAELLLAPVNLRNLSSYVPGPR